VLLTLVRLFLGGLCKPTTPRRQENRPLSRDSFSVVLVLLPCTQFIVSCSPCATLLFAIILVLFLVVLSLCCCVDCSDLLTLGELSSVSCYLWPLISGLLTRLQCQAVNLSQMPSPKHTHIHATPTQTPILLILMFKWCPISN
jgi:hypothetical protein